MDDPGDDLSGDFDQLDIHAVAKHLGCTLRQVIDHVDAGRLAAYQFGDTVWFRMSEVEALL